MLRKDFPEGTPHSDFQCGHSPGWFEQPFRIFRGLRSGRHNWALIRPLIERPSSPR